MLLVALWLTSRHWHGPCSGCGFRCYTANCMVNEMTLRVQTKQRNGKSVQPRMCETYRAELDTPLGETSLANLVYLVCLVLDQAATTNDTCLILGTTRDRTSYSCTVKLAGDGSTEYGASVEDFLAAVGNFLG